MLRSLCLSQGGSFDPATAQCYTPPRPPVQCRSSRRRPGHLIDDIDAARGGDDAPVCHRVEHAGPRGNALDDAAAERLTPIDPGHLDITIGSAGGMFGMRVLQPADGEDGPCLTDRSPNGRPPESELSTPIGAPKLKQSPRKRYGTGWARPHGEWRGR